ncbi:hypothetical protein CVT26_007979 [Gymnopilus dilepis]|uniref:Uncharacterized protein n=1 Tax=Gymnopilus dilepis TaxID=231916 RepID=A0A409W7I7_9AGAR|nr:hypothetical protein CVT26_007979 [Gymnopilus dilepis]
MEPVLSRHFPVITQRIQFRYAKPPAPPPITPRIDFGGSNSNDEIERNSSVEPAMICNIDSEIVISDDGESEVPCSDEEGTRMVGGMIMKPQGEPGRPNSGGYNLEKTLRGWTPRLFSDVSIFVKSLADVKLDMSKSYSRQNASAIKSICTAVRRILNKALLELDPFLYYLQATQHYAILAKYDNCWPVRDILKLHLKYKVETSRRQDKFRKKGPNETQIR